MEEDNGQRRESKIHPKSLSESENTLQATADITGLGFACYKGIWDCETMCSVWACSPTREGQGEQHPFGSSTVKRTEQG